MMKDGTKNGRRCGRDINAEETKIAKSISRAALSSLLSDNVWEELAQKKARQGKGLSENWVTTTLSRKSNRHSLVQERLSRTLSYNPYLYGKACESTPFPYSVSVLYKEAFESTPYSEFRTDVKRHVSLLL